MIELVDTQPDVQVPENEYLRLLGYPRDYEITGRAAELASWARQWYSENARPWVYARETAGVEIAGEAVRIEGQAFHSGRLRQTFGEGEAEGAVWAAASAGPEAEQHARQLWNEEKPDEYFFLETYAAAVTEHLVTNLGARLCAWAENHGMAILPHYSPGYTGWDVAEQPRLLSLSGDRLPGPLEALDSGALRPTKSQLVVFGITRDANSLHRLTEGVPCTNCTFQPCRFRRAPYRRTIATPPAEAVSYSINTRALERWTAQRLTLERRADGSVDARFRYDGTTCSNMGRPLAFDYFVTLGPREEGYPVRDQQCRPAPNDTGHRAMCQYIAAADALMASIESEKPMFGRPLADVLTWRRPASPAACYCDASSRQHKWGLVLETIHYALHKNGRL